MKNLTISLPDDVYQAARVRAAEEGISLTAMVRAYLTSLSDSESEFARLKALQDEVMAEIDARRARGERAGLRASENVSRDELHDRASLR